MTASQARKAARALKRELNAWLTRELEQGLFTDTALEAHILLRAIGAAFSERKQKGTPPVFTLELTPDWPEPERHWLEAGLSVKLSEKSTAELFRIFEKAAEGTNLSRKAIFVGQVFESLVQVPRSSKTANLERPDKETKAAELISFTQVLTPPAVVSYILEKSLGKALEQLPQERDKKLSALRKLKVLEPCVGTGNFYFTALEMLMPLYQELGLSSAQAFEETLRLNLFAMEMDGRALTVLKLLCAALAKDITGKPQLPALNCFLASDENLLGSLAPQLPESIADNQFDIVVANPPYLGRKLLDRNLKKLLKDLYPGCHNELGHCFLVRSLDWVKPGGRVGFIMQSSILSLPSAASIRRDILKHCCIEQVVNLGSRVFPLLSGEKADSAILILRKQEANDQTTISYFDLTRQEEKGLFLDRLSKQEKGAPLPFFKKQYDFNKHEGFTFNFKRPRTASLLYATLPRLSEKADIKQGLATSDNERFVRYSWEIENEEIGKSYRYYIKGKGARRWYHPLEDVVFWQDQGHLVKEAVNSAYPYLKGKVHWVVKNENYYFQPGLTFSFVNAQALAVRKMPAGCIFDVGGSAIFARDIEENLLLAYLNSGLAMTFAQDLNPTINFQVGDLKKIPVPFFEGECKDTLMDIAEQAVAISENLYHLESPYLLPRPGTRLIDKESFANYRKNHHLTQERLIELDCRNDELILKASATGLSLSEHTELLSWLDNFWRPETAKIKEAAEYCLSELATALYLLMKALSGKIADLNEFIQLKEGTEQLMTTTSLSGGSPLLVLDSIFFATALGVDLNTYLREKLNDKLRALYLQQPPYFILPCSKNTYLVPFLTFKQVYLKQDCQNSKENLLPENWCREADEKLQKLAAQLEDKEARARQLFSLIQ